MTKQWSLSVLWAQARNSLHLDKKVTTADIRLDEMSGDVAEGLLTDLSDDGEILPPFDISPEVGKRPGIMPRFDAVVSQIGPRNQGLDVFHGDPGLRFDIRSSGRSFIANGRRSGDEDQP